MTDADVAPEISGKSNLLEINLLPAPSDEDDFTTYWSTSTLGREVLQGKKLRNEKPKHPPVQKEYDVVNIDYIKSPCDARRRRKTRPKKHTRRIGSSRSDSMFLKSGMSNLTCTQRAKKICGINLRRRQKTHRRCPLRIAELAVPSKRQCIETWRNKHSVLPNYMVERLKRQVYDQNPIVQISDAIYCFKRLKHSPRKRSCKKTRVRCMENFCVSDAKALCAIFGYKIALHLNKPMTVIMCPRLETISNIVADDMISLIRKKTCMNNVVNQRILKEMAGKVSIWIEMILEQSTYKLQDDQLNDFEEEFGPVLDFIDELTESVLDICVPYTYYLYSGRESEESALGEQYEGGESEMFLPEETSISVESGLIIGDLGEIQTEDGFSLKEPDTSECDDILSISEYIKCEINNILKKIDKELEEDLKDKYSADLEDYPSVVVDTDKLEDNYKTPPETEPATPNPEEVVEYIDENPVDENLDPDNMQMTKSEENENIELVKENMDDVTPKPEDVVEYIDDNPVDENIDPDNMQMTISEENENIELVKENMDDDTPKPEDVVEYIDENAVNENLDPDNIKIKLSEENENIEPVKENIDDTVDANVSDEPQMLSEEPEDDSNKKVKFSDIDIGIKGEIENSSDLLDIQRDDQKSQISLKSSADNTSKLNINFAPPNENLLNEADESWPENIPSPSLRPSESISRSVTSLGKILEAEEKNLKSSESEDTTKKTKPETDTSHDKADTETAETRPKTQKEEPKQIKSPKKKKEHESLDSKKKPPTESHKTRKRSTSRDSGKAICRKPSTQDPTAKLGIKENADASPKDKRKQIQEKDQEKSDIRNKYKKPSIDSTVKLLNKKHKVSASKDPQQKRTEISEDIIHRHHSQQLKDSKRDFKVNEQTAPAWLQHKRVDFRKDNIYGLNQYEVRKWCRDLDQEYTRFEVWNNWLKCMSRNFIIMYQCRGMSRRINQCDYKHWLKFKKNIDKNVAIWAKLNRRTCHTLNKTIYICVKVSEASSSKRYSSRCISRNTKNTQSSPHCSTFMGF